MIAARIGRNVFIRRDMAETFAGIRSGAYRVNVHALPFVTMYIEAATVDDAHRIAIAAIRKERTLLNTGATIVKCAP